MEVLNLGPLVKILERDGYIIYISGPKERGKTDCALLLGEVSYLRKYRTKIATNIVVESYMIERQITNLPDLKQWLTEPGKKLFILDEAGLSIPKLRFMSAMNVEIMKLLQMIRHYDAGFIGIAPSTKNIDSTVSARIFIFIIFFLLFFFRFFFLILYGFGFGRFFCIINSFRNKVDNNALV